MAGHTSCKRCCPPSAEWDGCKAKASSNYNALQTSFQRRFTKGLAFDANYTWGKGLSDITGFSAEGGGRSWGNADPTRIGQLEYGVAENDIEHRFALSLNYSFQYGKQWHGLMKEVLAGYQVNTIAVWQSGKPFDIVNGGTSFDGPYSNRATPQNNGGPDRPNQIANPHVGHKTLSHYFSTAAFCGQAYAAGANPQDPNASCSTAQAQALGTIGTTQRDALFGPHFRHIDLSLFKDFPVNGAAQPAVPRGSVQHYQHAQLLHRRRQRQRATWQLCLRHSHPAGS